MAASPAGWRGLVARADRGAPRGGRTRQPRAERLADHRPRAGAGRGRCRGRSAGGARARRAATPLDLLRPLLGIPVALKDLVSRRAAASARPGSRILEGYRAPYDAHITERLREAGAVILGKTNMDEFAMGSSTEHSAYRPDRQPVGARPRAGRQQRRVGGGRGGVPRPAVDRHGHRRLHPPAGRAVRHRRDEADVRPGQPLRDRRVRDLARPDRAVRPRRPRCRGAAPRGRRARRPRLDVVARARPGDADRPADR